MDQYIICEYVDEPGYSYHALEIIPAYDAIDAVETAYRMGYRGALTAFNFQEITNEEEGYESFLYRCNL